MMDIVIPTLNEEFYLPELLKSLEKQTYKDFKVYVSDGGSKDKTVEAAKKFQDTLTLTVVSDNKKGVSHQRNMGARAGNSSIILFIDADVVLHPNFLLTITKQINGHNLANCWARTQSSNPVDQFLFLMYNLLALEIGKYIWPAGLGSSIYTTRKNFEDVGGFDESLVIWEDVDFIKRSLKAGANFIILRQPRIFLSTRRFEVEGRINILLEVAKGMQYSLRTGKMPTEKHISYPMGLNYTELLQQKRVSEKRLSKFLRQYTKYLRLMKELHISSIRRHVRIPTIREISVFLRNGNPNSPKTKQ
ncbi:MAG: glycosyltransferase family 2 protein [Patescibacteria group bacterium]|nr:glycosyltransferase family 2 protein [Patescibacteria group bacterium]